MDFYSGFSWAVPTHFSDAIANCKFEEGDVIYDSESAYRKWGKALETVSNCIKVKLPKRTIRVTKGKSESVALANWTSEAIIEFHKLQDKIPYQMIQTTQGRIFSLLWKGEPGILNKEMPEPSPPLFLQDVKKVVADTSCSCRKIAGYKPYFIMVHDPTNEVSLKKHSDIFSTLKNKFGCELYQVNPENSGFKEWDKISPVICTNLYVIGAGNCDDIERELKTVLYKPTKGAGKDKFKLKTHGRFFGTEKI